MIVKMEQDELRCAIVALSFLVRDRWDTVDLSNALIKIDPNFQKYIHPILWRMFSKNKLSMDDVASLYMKLGLEYIRQVTADNGQSIARMIELNNNEQILKHTKVWIATLLRNGLEEEKIKTILESQYFADPSGLIEEVKKEDVNGENQTDQ